MPVISLGGSGVIQRPSVRVLGADKCDDAMVTSVRRHSPDAYRDQTREIIKKQNGPACSRSRSAVKMKLKQGRNLAPKARVAVVT